MISCSKLLDEYSDYRDGLMAAERAAQVEAHLAECPSCARYDRVLVAGLGELRKLPAVGGSCDFLPRLQHRIFHLEEEAAGWSEPRASRTTLGVVVLLVLLMGSAAWLPALRASTPVVHLPPVAAVGPPPVRPIPSLFRSGPLLPPPPTALTTFSAEDRFLRQPPLASTPTLQSRTLSLGTR